MLLTIFIITVRHRILFFWRMICQMRSRTSLQNYLFVVELCHSNTWGISSVGRAFEWHSKGQRFNSAMLHHLKSRYHISGFFNINACSPKKILKKALQLCSVYGMIINTMGIVNLKCRILKFLFRRIMRR